MNGIIASFGASACLAFVGALRQARQNGFNSESLNSGSGQAPPTLGFSNRRSEASSISQSTIPA